MPMLLSRLMGAGVSPMLALVMGDDFTNNITATGTTQTDAFTISTATTRFTTVASGTGARLPNYNRGDSVLVINDGANALNLYPAVGHSINSLATNVAISIPASSSLWLDRVTNTKWAAGDASGVPFTPSGTGAIATNIQDELRYLGARPEQFGAVGDGVIDDNVALQKWLNKGGKLYLGNGKTYRNAAANLTTVANTDILIERGATLKLDTTRLTTLNVNNVHIYVHGQITSVNLNTTDALNTDWDGRGIVEFGGTVASPISNTAIYGPGSVSADWTGTPGAIVPIVNDRRRGVVSFYCQNHRVENLEVFGVVAEAIRHTSNVNDRAVWFVKNYSHDNNHDALNFNAGLATEFFMLDNYGRRCLNGIEVSGGTIKGNTMVSMVGGGYTFGAGNGTGPIIVEGNRGINNGQGGTFSNDFELSFNTPTGPVVVIGNESFNAGKAAFNVAFCRDLTFIGNSAIGHGTSAAASGIGISNATRGVCAWNRISNPGANANGGYNFGSNTDLQIGPNSAQGQTTVTTGFDATNGHVPQYSTMFSRVSSNSVTGTLTETTLYTATIKGKTLGKTGGFRVRASGTIAGVNNTKTIRLKFGSVVIGTLTEAAGATDQWVFDALLINADNEALQNGHVIVYQATTINSNSVYNGNVAVDTTADQTVSLTGQLANIGDTITLVQMTIEPFWGILG